MATAPAPPSAPVTAEAQTSGGTIATAPSDNVQKYIQNDPKRTGFDPATAWWMTYFRILTGQVSSEGVHHYREWRYRQNEERDCRRCEEARDYLLRYSPIIRFLSERTTQLGGHQMDASNIVCARCPARVAEVEVDVETETETPGQETTAKTAQKQKQLRVVRQGGGFHPAFGILLCANEMRDRKHLEDNLAHEMVHAYDHLRWNVDWDNLRHAACSEIRASMLSGECRYSREAFTRGNWSLTEQFQRCVRSRAIQSLTARPRCRDDVHATKVVNEVWDSCFSDTRPFDDIYK
ncbi:mitochondrial inner membrane protease [Grosmannia clavigera kw1407]|uniref:Mitochondrial inner membrane protease ATP23 n=1 Tax=Grosmannia clavigera (strain kw1407 / UAMH 11150) TaxID=655863 RepID=F0XQ14_GROCL|nr:mitochondrial inner membrane protease [Grosmannia clavigera kw1407]EFX00724.1 mitochondrial inner membrane protease [Grosmannia clavigera kw1407]